jgi:hypothetical protein
MNPLSQVNSPEYMAEWGEPQSSRRLRKLANSMATFRNNAANRTAHDMVQATSEWRADLDWLWEEFHEARLGFPWPECAE